MFSEIHFIFKLFETKDLFCLIVLLFYRESFIVKSIHNSKDSLKKV